MKAKSHPQAVNRCSKTYSHKVRRERNRWKRPNSRKNAASKPEREKRVSYAVAPEISERLPRSLSLSERKARDRSGQRHLSFRRSVTEADLRARRSREAQPRPGAAAWGLRGSLSAASKPGAGRRGRGPSSRGAALPRPLPYRSAGGAQYLRPNPGAPLLGHAQLRGGGAATTTSGTVERTPLAGPAPGKAYSPGLPSRRLGPPPPPPSPLRLPWLSGLAALGVGTRLGQGVVAGLCSGPTSRLRALTGPGALGRAAGLRGPRPAASSSEATRSREGQRVCCCQPRAGGKSQRWGAAWEPWGGAGAGLGALGAAQGGFVYFLRWLRHWRVGRGSLVTLAPRSGERTRTTCLRRGATGPGRVQTSRVGGGALVLGWPGREGLSQSGWKEGGLPRAIGSRAFPRSSAASPALWRVVRGPWSGEELWNLVVQIPCHSGLDL